MTGFLQRLAERAMGVSRPARTMSAAPFAPAPVLLEEVSSQAGPSITAQVPAVRGTATPATRPANSAGAGWPEGASGQGAATAPPHPRDSTVAGAAPGNRPREVAVPAVAAHAIAATIPRSGPMGLEPADETPRTLLSPSGERAPRHVAYVQSDSSPAASMADRPDAGQPGQAQPTQPVLPRIAPLLPRTPIEAYGQVPNPPGIPGHGGRMESGVVEESIEVQVSIGRIEVTAVHEPGPAKTPAQRRQAPMSLDDYLAKRHGGRP